MSSLHYVNLSLLFNSILLNNVLTEKTKTQILNLISKDIKEELNHE